MMFKCKVDKQQAQFNCYFDAGSFFYLPVKIEAKATTT